MKPRPVGVVGWAYLVGCALLIALWVRSLPHADALAFFAHRGAVQVVASDGGGLAMVLTNLEVGADRAGTFDYAHYDPEMWNLSDVEHAHTWGGFGWGTGPTPVDMPDPRRFAVLMAPHWFVALLLAVPGVRAVARSRRERRRLSTGLCVRCGYDLRESPDRCPECGAAARAQVNDCAPVMPSAHDQ